MSTKMVETKYRHLTVTLEDIFRLITSAAARGEIRVEGLSPSSRLCQTRDGEPFATTYGEWQPFGSSGVSQVVRIRESIGLTVENDENLSVPEGSYIPAANIEWGD